MKIDELNACFSGMSGKNIEWAGDSVAIEMADGVEIHLERVEGKGELFLYGYLEAIPAGGMEKFALAFLKANLFAGETGGNAVIAFDEETGRPVIWDRVDLSAISLPDFQERLSRLYLSLSRWSERISRNQ